MSNPAGVDSPTRDEVTPETPTETPQEAPDAVPDRLPGDAAPDSVLGRLRRAYADNAGIEERTEVLPIAPGLYGGELAAKYKPIDPTLRRKLQRRFEKIGRSDAEANLEFQSTLLADACITIMMRPEGGGEYVEAHTLPEVRALTGGQVVRYDRNLAAILGMDPPEGATQGDVARLVFTEAPIFEAHYNGFSIWSTGLASLDDDEDDEDGGGAERPM